jgi:RNA polymerase sigma factor (sigma-70 family)
LVNQGMMDDFETIFHQYKNWVYKTAYLIVRDPHRAEDIMQEVFINAYKSGHTFDPQKGSYRNWLRAITVKQCFARKSKKHQGSFSLDELEEKGLSVADKSPSIPDQVSLKDDMKRLIDSLSPKYRATLLLRYYEGLSYDEIAQVLDIPLGTVKSRINAAVLRLRKTQKETARKNKL